MVPAWTGLAGLRRSARSAARVAGMRTSPVADPRRRPIVSVAVCLVAALVVGACGFGVRPTPAEHFIVPAPPMPQPPPAIKVPKAAIEAFVKNATSGTWSYRVNFKGRAAGAGNLGVVEGHMNVSG